MLQVVSWPIALGQLGAAATLIVFAIAATGWKVRTLAVLTAFVIIASTPGLGMVFGIGGGQGIMWASPIIEFAVNAAAIASFFVAIWIFVQRVLLPSARKVVRRNSVEQTLAASDARQMRLRDLLKREHQRLKTVNEMHRCFELATRNSQITVFYQDAQLAYQWVVNPRPALAPGDIIGKVDEELLPESLRPLVIGHKRRALATNTTQTFEVELAGEEERNWFRVDVVPIADKGKEPVGIVCTAIDITRSKRLDMMRTDLSRRLAETLQRFNLALRSERIMVFSQDAQLRYTWANSDETQVGSIIGRTDDEVLPEEDREAIVAMKRQVIETKRPASAEVGVGSGAERRWYDMHVEPNMRPDGTVSGVTGASIDITHRRRNEEQMRLVMRELTHRTKNLLTVVIAIARQTSTQAKTVESFIPALVGRLRALSAAQDLIVADEWAGVKIGDLISVLVGQYVPPHSSRVMLTGPEVVLSPESSQNLGLAIHELAANAMQYGAFANTSGMLAVDWRVYEAPEGEKLEISWVETGGPPVAEPTTRGFGMTVIERNLSRALGAEVDLTFPRAGLSAKITLPMKSVVPFSSPDRIRLAEAS
ncbi:PAS domain-containing protein [Acuticoccus kandeliae]|uniref:PAS domain-containing protein n=1 Tax=Acuticoccus kandeliae TaxID=2073160 RepID=UPI000D3EC063|nr:PAS domain-containing protein [Acuticoccus kandeliae]